MFAKIHSNLHSDIIATTITKTAFHRWLNGGIPHLGKIAACDKALQTETSLSYVEKFSNTALMLYRTQDLSKIKPILERSGLSDEDKTLLGNHHKRRIWREHNQTIDGNISFFEIRESGND